MNGEKNNDVLNTYFPHCGTHMNHYATGHSDKGDNNILSDFMALLLIFVDVTILVS